MTNIQVLSIGDKLFRYGDFFSEKILGTIPNVKFFTADPYFGVVFSTGLRKSAQNSTFLRFLTYRGGRVGPKKYGPQNIVGQG